MQNPAYLTLSEYSIYHFRWPVPPHLLPDNKRRYVKLSLQTREPKEALYLAQVMTYRATSIIQQEWVKAMPYQQIKAIVQEYCQQFLDEKKRRILEGDILPPNEIARFQSFIDDTAFRSELVEDGMLDYSDVLTKLLTTMHLDIADNQQEVLDALYISFKRAVKCITPLNLNGTFLLFKELDDDRRQELLEYYIEQRSDEPELFDIENRDTFIFGTPLPEVAAAFQRKHQSLTQANPISLAEVITGIAEGKIRPEKHLETLISATEDDYYNFYKSLRDKSLPTYLNVTLINLEYDDGRKPIGEKALAAIRRLASESLINSRRLQKYVNLAKVQEPTLENAA